MPHLPMHHARARVKGTAYRVGHHACLPYKHALQSCPAALSLPNLSRAQALRARKNACIMGCTLKNIKIFYTGSASDTTKHPRVEKAIGGCFFVGHNALIDPMVMPLIFLELITINQGEQ